MPDLQRARTSALPVPVSSCGATMIHLPSRFGVNPIPFVILQVFATNIGSSATVVGNPIGVMIAMRAGLTFQDFLRWASPISLCALAVTVPLSLLYYLKEIRGWKQNMISRGLEKQENPSPRNTRQWLICLALFIGTVTGLVLHAPLERLLVGWGRDDGCRNQPSSG